ncbi:hypothetical protein BDN72DRAFT_846439, partial [Pluteus cervinus]
DISPAHRLIITHSAGDVHQCTSLPAPILRSVELQGVELPEELFSGVAPCLKSIDLIGCTGFRLQNVPFTQLTEVKLIRPRPKPSILEWLTGLLSLPNLRRLTLDDALDTSTRNPEADLPHVDLPNLQFLTMKNFTETTPLCSLLLCQISGHTNLITDIQASELHGHFPEYLRLLTHLQVFEPSHSMSFHISYSYFNLVVFGPNGDRVTSIEVLSRWMGRDQLVAILRQIPLHTLSSITFMDSCYNTFPFPRELWSHLLSPLPNLREMHLGAMYAASFMSYIGSFHAPTSPTTPPQPLNPYPPTTPANANDLMGPAAPFSALRSLTLEAFSGESPTWAMSAQLAHGFWKTLETRMKSGVGLEELILIDITVPRFEDVPLVKCAERVEEKGMVPTTPLQTFIPY